MPSRGQFETAALGQLAVDENHVEGVVRSGLSQKAYGVGAVGLSGGVDAELVKGQHHDVQGQGAVVDDENTQIVQGVRVLRRRKVLGKGQYGDEFEVAAFARLACDKDIPSHAPGQMGECAQAPRGAGNWRAADAPYAEATRASAVMSKLTRDALEKTTGLAARAQANSHGWETGGGGIFYALRIPAWRGFRLTSALVVCRRGMPPMRQIAARVPGCQKVS